MRIGAPRILGTLTSVGYMGLGNAEASLHCHMDADEGDIFCLFEPVLFN
jgi:hypothetical protein